MRNHESAEDQKLIRICEMIITRVDFNVDSLVEPTEELFED